MRIGRIVGRHPRAVPQHKADIEPVGFANMREEWAKDVEAVLRRTCGAYSAIRRLNRWPLATFAAAMLMEAMIIAIDGPAASGKGTLGKRLAAHYRFRHLDTGLLYRAVAKAVLDAGGKPEDSAAAIAAARDFKAAWIEDALSRATGSAAPPRSSPLFPMSGPP